MSTQPTINKTFVLDTSVLIHDPDSIFNFSEHDVAIPIEVLQELDRLKEESSERGKSARSVQRKLLAILGENTLDTPANLPTNFNDGFSYPNNSGNSSHEKKGKLSLILPPAKTTQKGSNEIKRIVGDMDSPDHRIIAAASWLSKTKPDSGIVLVTKDMGMMLKARALGIQVEDYKHDKSSESQPKETIKLEIDSKDFQRFISEGYIELGKELGKDLSINEYGLFTSEKKTPWRHLGDGRFIKINPIAQSGFQIPNGINIKARNLEQVFLLDALLNPEITLVTSAALAGTGKTLLAVAASLYLIGKRNYTGMCISRPIEPVGKESGFLPGILEEKLRPWLQPYADALNFLHTKIPPQNKKQSERKKGVGGANDKNSQIKRPYDLLTESGIVEVTAIEYIRGRSIPNKIFICDELQNCQKGVIKTIASRMGEGAKLICLGDLDQIDNPYLDKYSNGLSHVRNNMRDLPNVAHTTLIKGERSLLAEQAAMLL